MTFGLLLKTGKRVGADCAGQVCADCAGQVCADCAGQRYSATPTALYSPRPRPRPPPWDFAGRKNPLKLN